MSECRGCGAGVVWAVTEAGKRMPLDAGPDGAPLVVDGGVVVPAGRWEPSAGGAVPVVRVVTGAELSLFDAGPETRWQSHFVSCPQADEFRRPR